MPPWAAAPIPSRTIAAGAKQASTDQHKAATPVPIEIHLGEWRYHRLIMSDTNPEHATSEVGFQKATQACTVQAGPERQSQGNPPKSPDRKPSARPLRTSCTNSIR